MAGKKTGLGRGLDALFPEKKETGKSTAPETAKTKEEKSKVVLPEKTKELMAKISKVEPSRTQPRKKFTEESLLELAESIKHCGMLQPILVSDKNGYYEIIAGERRWRAAKLAGLKEVPILVKELTEQEIIEVSLIENIQRENLNPIEEAGAYQRLIEEFHLKQEEIAERVAKSRTAVANTLRLLKLDSRVQQMLVEETLSAGHARALLGISDQELQWNLAVKILDAKLSVRETEKMVKMILEPSEKKQPVKNSAEDAVYESLEEKMKSIIGTRVCIHRKNKDKGKIEIEYYSKEDLERIIELFEGIPSL